MPKSDNTSPHSSQTYDTQVHNTIPYYDAFHEQTINLIKAVKPQPKTWLDTGCGTGTLTEKAIVQFPNTKFVLADPSQQMLQAAKNKLPKTANIEFLEASPTQNLTLPNGSFDVVTAIQAHHYLTAEERTKATAACFKLLTKGGVYVTFENVKPTTPEGVKVGKELWKQFQLSKGKTADSVEEHLKRFGIEYLPITLKEHLKLLKKTGFSTIEMLWYSYMQAGIYAIK
jgi:tRNA (cmo5U34)-methyltransferase